MLNPNELLLTFGSFTPSKVAPLMAITDHGQLLLTSQSSITVLDVTSVTKLLLLLQCKYAQRRPSRWPALRHGNILVVVVL